MAARWRRAGSLASNAGELQVRESKGSDKVAEGSGQRQACSVQRQAQFVPVTMAEEKRVEPEMCEIFGVIGAVGVEVRYCWSWSSGALSLMEGNR